MSILSRSYWWWISLCLFCAHFMTKNELSSCTPEFQISITGIHTVTWWIPKMWKYWKKNANYMHFVMELFKNRHSWDASLELDELYEEIISLYIYICILFLIALLYIYIYIYTVSYCTIHADGLGRDCGEPIVYTLELLQSWADQSTCS